MKKIFIYAVLIIFLILFINIQTFGQEKEGQFSLLNVSLHYAISLFNPSNIIIGADYMYYFNWIGLGIGFDYLYNLKYNDTYLNLLLKLGLGRFFIEGGATLPINSPSQKYNMIQFEKKFYPYIGINWDIILGFTQKGTLNLNLYLAMMFTSMEVLDPQQSNFFSQLIMAIVLNGLGITLNSFKFGVGLSYSFYL